MAGLLGRGVLAGAKLVNKGNPLWSILGRGRFNPFRGPQQTYRGQPFPEPTRVTGWGKGVKDTVPTGGSNWTEGPIRGLPLSGRFQSPGGGWGVQHGGIMRGQPVVNPRSQAMIDPRQLGATRPGFLNPRAHPYRAGAVGAAATLGLPALWRGGEEEMPNISGTRMPPPEVSMQGLPSYSDRLF